MSARLSVPRLSVILGFRRDFSRCLASCRYPGQEAESRGQSRQEDIFSNDSLGLVLVNVSLARKKNGQYEDRTCELWSRSLARKPRLGLVLVNVGLGRKQNHADCLGGKPFFRMTVLDWFY